MDSRRDLAADLLIPRREAADSFNMFKFSSLLLSSELLDVLFKIEEPVIFL